MKIVVHVEDYFDPTAGYQVNELLKVSSNNKTYIITSKDMTPFHKNLNVEEDIKFEKKYGVKILRLDTIIKISTRLILRGLWTVIDKLKPDIVFLHGIGDFKDLVLLKKKKKYIIFRDCHMSWIASKNKFAKYFYKFYALFFARVINRTDKYEKVFALGVEEYQYLKALELNDSKIDYLYHGYNDEIMYYSDMERNEIRSIYKIEEDEIVISYIGKFDNSKRPDLVLDIVGNLNQSTLEDKKITLLFIGSKDKEFMKGFYEKLNLLPKNIRVIEDNNKPFESLRKYFSATDICIFPKETTLSSIHAQVCRCPVVMENHVSNKERVILNENLYAIDEQTEAVNILERIIKNKEYKKDKSLSKIDKLKEREYKNQVKKLNLNDDE